MVQGGDVVNNDGTDGESIYGDTFEDENFTIKHACKGMVGMMNQGPNSNQSQFYITTEPCIHLDDTNVVVGKIVKGLKIIIEMSDYNREDKTPVVLSIENCGELKPGEPWMIHENDGTEDIYPPWPDDWELYSSANSWLVKKAVSAIKNSGNFYFGRNDFLNSERKYVKCLRYIDWYLLEHKDTVLYDTRVLVMLNLAAALLKSQQYKETVKVCGEILKIDQSNAKALYRRAQASLAMKNYDEALEDLNSASAFQPNDRNILNVLNTVKKRKFTYLQDEKLFFSKLFKHI